VTSQWGAMKTNNLYCLLQGITKTKGRHIASPYNDHKTTCINTSSFAQFIPLKLHSAALDYTHVRFVLYIYSLPLHI
jgi:hypothetical protein